MRDFVYICWKRREYIGCGRRDGPLESTPNTAEDGWIYVVKENGENGFVPATYVEPTDNGLWILGNALYDYEGHLAEGRYL